MLHSLRRYFLLGLAIAAAASAQDFRATLSGQVTDPTGASVPDASVRATNRETNQSVDVKTNADGHYTIPYLAPGNYNVEVTAPGFQKLVREDIVLRVADKIDLPLQLTVGQMSQEVTVTGRQEVLDTENADRGLVFNPIMAQQLPLNGRQEYMLMELTPGVIFTQEQFGASGFSGPRGWDVNSSYKINGARPGENVFLLNGAPISDNGGTWDLAPNIEAVQEFKVMTNTYDAQYGHFGGGAVNTTLKSGTNAWHGDVFDYFRNSYMDANNFGNNFNGQPTPFHNQHQFGGVVGGPIRKDKDFIFFSFEGWREVIPAPATDTVPTADMKNGNFGSAGIVIYDPLTSVPCNAASNCSGHSYVRSPFPGGIIPANRISPVAQKILSYYPNPTTGGIQNNYNAPNVKDQYMYNQPMVRWDHNFGEKNKLFAIFTGQHGTENRNSTGLAPPADEGNINNARSDQNYIAGYTRILSPTAVFDAHLSFGRYTNDQPSQGDPSFKSADLGIHMPCPPTIPVCSAPSITFSNGYTTLFGTGNIINWYSYNTWQFLPSLTLNRGSHTLHIGFEWLYVIRPSENAGYASGRLNFTQSWTQHYNDSNQGSTDGSAIASLLLGYPDSSNSFIDYNSQLYISRPYYAGYIQDDWKVNRRLTLTMGLRYEVQIPWKDRYNRVTRGFDYNTVNPDSAAIIANWNTVAAQYNATNPSTPYPAAPSAIYGGLLYAGVN